jgi:hypothetical protein
MCHSLLRIVEFRENRRRERRKWNCILICTVNCVTFGNEKNKKKLCKVGVLCNVTEYTVRSLVYYRMLFILDTSLFLLHILIKGQEKHGSE